MVLNTNNNINNNNEPLDPNYITGYTDGEGSFSVRIGKTQNNKIRIIPVYSICAQINPPNKLLLEKVKEFFENKGSISRSNNMFSYEITGLTSLRFVEHHFKNFPLESSKIIHFKL